MTLQYKLDSTEGLSEEIAKLYIEKDGVFILDVTGHEKTEKQNKNLIPKARLDQEIEKRKEAEKGLTEICDNLIEDIDESKRSLIPDLPAAKKIAWIRQANVAGVFEDKKVESLDSQKPGDQKPKDFEGMSPQAIMATGYNSNK
jgi:hypothetical protein